MFMSFINEIPTGCRTWRRCSNRRAVVRCKIVTSVISVAEVAFAAREQRARTLDPEQEARIGALWELGAPVQLVDVHLLIAEGARTLQRAGVPSGMTGLRSADAIHLATAQHEDVTEVNTYDDWDRYAAVIGRPIRRPIASQPLLGLGP